MLGRLTDQISDPVKFRRLNGWLVIFWLGMMPVAIITGLVNLLWFVTILSLYANFATHLGAWAASRAEVKADIGVAQASIRAETASVEANEVSVHSTSDNASMV
jgi:hypothetical protein